MKFKLSSILISLGAAASLCACTADQRPIDQPVVDTTIRWEAGCPPDGEWTMALHGGAGVILRENLSAERETDYRSSITATLETGAKMLRDGAGALDVIEIAVRGMENDPKFNAGKGAVFSAAGINELDAAIMDGRTRNAGAVASVKTIKNPISLARKVLEESRHVMMIGEGAEQFADQHGIEKVDPKYFHTDRRWNALQEKLKKKQGVIERPENKYGTVGVVVKDACGNLAAGTSTGGLTGKEFGRVGDTPIIGAGTYADNRYCAVSATGTGEYFIRATIARDVCARREFAGETLQTAMDTIIHGTLTDMGGDGGIVAVDNEGNFGFSFNTDGMYRGAVKNDTPAIVEIFKK